MIPTLLICSCRIYKDYLHAAVRRFASPYWRCIGVIGGDTLSFDASTSIVTLPVEDTYEALPMKVHAAITWIMQQYPDTPGIFKTDEDIVFQSLHDLEAAIAANASLEYWGLVTERCTAAYIPLLRIQRCFTNKSLRPSYPAAHYCYGHGYWLGRAAIARILAAKKEYENAYMEDICTGAVLNASGIDPTCIPVAYAEVNRTPALLEL